MKKRNAASKMLRISMCWFFLSACTVFLTVIIPENAKGISSEGIIIGITFWTGILFGILFYILSLQKLRRLEEYKKIKENYKPAWCSIGKTLYGAIADGIFVISLLLTVLGNTVWMFPNIIMMFCMFFLIYSFCLRFIFNGRVYRYISKGRKKKGGKDYEKVEKSLD